MIERICPTCSKVFEVKYKSQGKKYCTLKCACAKNGGFREGSGRAKTGYYKGIYCGSTYELCWVIYQLDNKIPFERFKGCLEKDGRKYFPDFLQNNVIIEIKGCESPESVERKNLIAAHNGFDVLVLRKDDLQHCFRWVNDHYGKQHHTLYDDYAPKYEYICSCCNKKVERDKKSKFERVYCSRKCSLKGNRKTPSKKQSNIHREAAGVATSPSN